MPSGSEPLVFEWVEVDWVFKVVDGQTSVRAADAFEQVLKFWTDVSYANKIN